MKEFLEWKLGDRQLPAKCVMITIDDGWKSVYTDAYPILKETGFPFTISHTPNSSRAAVLP